MKILVLLFAMFMGFGLLIQNTFAPRKPKPQIRYEYQVAATVPTQVLTTVQV